MASATPMSLSPSSGEIMFDVGIVGGGPAGLSAALIFGRCRRRVLVCDAGRPRKARTRRANGFSTRDGTAPTELRRLGREQLGAYGGVELRDIEVKDAKRTSQGFELTLEDGTRHPVRKLLLATGVVDELPQIEGFEALCGLSIHHCPYCDGWEHRSLGDSTFRHMPVSRRALLVTAPVTIAVAAALNWGWLVAGFRYLREEIS